MESSSRFTSAEGGARLAAASGTKNILVTEYASFIPNNLLVENAYNIRGLFSNGNQRSVYITRSSRIDCVAHDLTILTDLKISKARVYTDVIDWTEEIETKEVLVCTSEVAKNILYEGVLRIPNINVLIIDSCHLIFVDENLQFIMKLYKECDENARPRILALTYPLFTAPKDNDSANEIDKNDIDISTNKNFSNTDQNKYLEDETKDNCDLKNNLTEIDKNDIELSTNKNDSNTENSKHLEDETKDNCDLKNNLTEIDKNDIELSTNKNGSNTENSKHLEDETKDNCDFKNDLTDGTEIKEKIQNTLKPDKKFKGVVDKEKNIDTIDKCLQNNFDQKNRKSDKDIGLEKICIEKNDSVSEKDVDIVEENYEKKDLKSVKNVHSLENIDDEMKDYNSENYVDNLNKIDNEKKDPNSLKHVENCEKIDDEKKDLSEKDVDHKIGEKKDKIGGIEKEDSVVGFYKNFDDFDMYEKLEWKIEELEKELCCEMDLAEDIDGGKRLLVTVSKPKELIVEFNSGPTDCFMSEQYKNLVTFMKTTVAHTMDFLLEHRYDPTEIYGEDLYEEFMNIPDPIIEPKLVFDEFLYVLEQLGPYAADKAAFSLLTKLEKLKVKVPYERHFLLLCLCTSVFVKIRCYADSVFSKYESDWEKITLFCTPKVLRFAEILEQFQPPENLKLDTIIQDSTNTEIKDNNVIVNNKDNVISASNNNATDDPEFIYSYSDDEVKDASNGIKKSKTLDLLSEIDKCDFVSLGNKLEDRVNTYEANLKDLDDFDGNNMTYDNLNPSKVDNDGINHAVNNDKLTKLDNDNILNKNKNTVHYKKIVKIDDNKINKDITNEMKLDTISQTDVDCKICTQTDTDGDRLGNCKAISESHGVSIGKLNVDENSKTKIDNRDIIESDDDDCDSRTGIDNKHDNKIHGGENSKPKIDKWDISNIDKSYSDSNKGIDIKDTIHSKTIDNRNSKNQGVSVGAGTTNKAKTDCEIGDNDSKTKIDNRDIGEVDGDSVKEIDNSVSVDAETKRNVKTVSKANCDENNKTKIGRKDIDEVVGYSEREMDNGVSVDVGINNVISASGFRNMLDMERIVMKRPHKVRARGKSRAHAARLHQLQLHPDALCGIVFLREPLMAKIMFMIIVDMSRSRPSLSHLCAQYCAVEEAAELRETQRQGRKQEDVLKKFRMHECNLLLATPALEEGIDLPRCNLVVRWDIPPSYRSHGLCKGRARAARSTVTVLTDPGCRWRVTHHLAVYKELDQIITRKCGCGIQNEPPQDEENHADGFVHIIKPYTPADTTPGTDNNDAKASTEKKDSDSDDNTEGDGLDCTNNDVMSPIRHGHKVTDGKHSAEIHQDTDDEISDDNTEPDGINTKPCTNDDITDGHKVTDDKRSTDTQKYISSYTSDGNTISDAIDSVNTKVYTDQKFDDSNAIISSQIDYKEFADKSLEVKDCNDRADEIQDGDSKNGQSSQISTNVDLDTVSDIIDSKNTSHTIHNQNNQSEHTDNKRINNETDTIIEIDTVLHKEKNIGHRIETFKEILPPDPSIKENEVDSPVVDTEVDSGDNPTDDADDNLQENLTKMDGDSKMDSNVNITYEFCKSNLSKEDSNTASVDLNSAIALINRYCGKLPSDTFTRLAPQWWMERVRLPDGLGQLRTAYICTLRMPLNCPVKYNIVGHPMPTRVLARRMVALQACRILHKSGELDNQLMPIGKENFKAPDLDSVNCNDTSDANDCARPGTTKRRQYYYKRTAWAFTNCQPIIDFTDEDITANTIPRPEELARARNTVWAVAARLWCALPERYNTRGRRLHAPQMARQALGLLLAKREPQRLQIPAFPVYTRSGEVRVSVEPALDADVRLSPRRAKLIRRFMQFVFSDVLRVRRGGMKMKTEGSTHNNYYVVPTIKKTREWNGSSMVDIDWDFLELIYQHTEEQKILEVQKPVWTDEEDKKGKKRDEKVVKIENPLLKKGEVFTFDAEKYNEAVVTPWYRNQDQPQFFLVAEICWNLTPDSAFPSTQHASFRSYYQAKYGAELTQSDQPLLDVDHTSARLNLLTPRYVNRKGVALPVSSERTRRNKRDRLDQKQILVPELCRRHPFAAPLWFATVALPCVLYRINALLIADEIRRAVAIDVGLGLPRIDEQTCPGFSWPPLDFGWSLAEVLSADSEKTDKKKEDGSLIEYNENEPEEEVEGEIEVKAKTLNDILQEKLDAENAFEIGTWSNDMAASIPDPDEYDELLEPLPPNLTFCTSASGGANWSEPIEKRKTSFNPTRTYSVAESDCSYFSSDFDTDDSDLDSDGSDEDTDTSGFWSSKHSNAAMGVRIEYKTAHEAEAVDLERRKPVAPGPQPDKDDDERDMAAFKVILKDGVPPVEILDKFRNSVAQHETDIKERYFIAKDEPIVDLLPETPKHNRPTDNISINQTKTNNEIIVDNTLENNEETIIIVNNPKDNVDMAQRNVFDDKVINLNDNSKHKLDIAQSLISFDTKDTISVDISNNDHSSVGRIKNCTIKDNAKDKDTSVKDNLVKEIFPYNDIELGNGELTLEDIEKNKRILLDVLKKSLPDEEVKKLNCFTMEDVDIDSPNYVNEKVENVGFDTKDKYRNVVNSWAAETEYRPYFADNKGQSGKEFDFDYQPDLEGHPGPSPSVILQALTMSNANDGINLERLETIGDSFLKFAITAYLYCAHPAVHEGKLSHMRSKQVSNLNLYRLGRNKRLGARMIASKFEPHDNWLPPCHKPPPTLQPSATADARKQVQNHEVPVDNTGCFIPYNLITQHSIPDKSIADCVEALIGAYLLECGPRGALLFMSWLGIRVLPCHLLPLEPDHPYVRAQVGSERQKSQSKQKDEKTKAKLRKSKSSESECSSDESDGDLHDWSWPRRPVGGLRPRLEGGRWVQPIFGELKAPPSPLLRYIEDPDGELEKLLSGYEVLEQTLQYRFRDRSLLLQALTHASRQDNRLTDCYQRLEFLGDAILDYLITRHLYEDPRRHSPGALTDLRSALVNNTIFATLAARHGFHKYFRHMSPGLNEVLTKYVKIQEENGHSISEEHYLIQEDEMEQAEDVEVPKALGDLFESVAGAIFLDSGMSLGAVWKSYVNLMGAELEAFSAAAPKSPVRELLEAEPDTAKFGKPERLADGRRVRVCVEVFGRGAFKGVGRNYRIAKGTAARCALRHLKAARNMRR